MGQISGIQASLITNIAGIQAANISSIGPVSAATLGLGGGSVAPGNFPYSFIPGSDTVSGAVFSKASDVSNPSGYKILGPERFEDSDGNSTFELSNISSKFYNLDAENLQSFTISQWVRVNNFPKRSRNGGFIRKKRTSLARYDFKSTTTEGLSQGYIEFGATAPYYTNGVDFSKKYQYTYEPFSFGVCISNGKHPITLYTDYKFQLGTWYMLTVQVTLSAPGDFTNPTAAKSVKLWINNQVENTALFLGKPWSTKVKSKYYNDNRNRGNSGGSRLGNIFANIPEFKDYYLNSIYNQPQWSLTFKSFVNIFEMNHASFSPVKRFNTSNTGNVQPTYNSSMVNRNSYVDFGELNIYDSLNGFNTQELYGATFNHYI